ncbi:hypothetical protein [Maribellus sp. YY47]|uniref:hypothetical protein n=1 Tax=Maribellus sp. YY47 TaxID=2929486 RepID=UPI002000F214|nr:hypothetical protein [Maribellus sp. YY47]MCK3682535.1 hypothetical protein [Maribellus sp. YY47]
MKLKTRILTLLLLLFFIAESCSKSEDEVPNYVGNWVRTWKDKEMNANLKQSLILETNAFSSEISIQSGDSLVLYKKFSGTITRVHQSLRYQMEQLNVYSDGDEVVNTRFGDTDFDEDVFSYLSIHPNFWGVWYFAYGNLTLWFDMDGDKIATGTEGRFVFQQE